MIKRAFLKDLTNSMVSVGYQYVTIFGELRSRICGTGFVLEGKYIITSSKAYSAISLHDCNGAPISIFASISGETMPMSYIDSDTRRNLSVFEIAELPRKEHAGKGRMVGMKIESLAWGELAGDQDADQAGADRTGDEETADEDEKYADDNTRPSVYDRQEDVRGYDQDDSDDDDDDTEDGNRGFPAAPAIGIPMPAATSPETSDRMVE